MNILKQFMLIALIASFVASAEADATQSYSGSVDHVFNGNTLRLQYKWGQIKVRLAALEAPVPGTPEGEQARAALREIVLGKVLTVHDGQWRNGFFIGRGYLEDGDVCSRMLTAGFARVAPAYRHLAKLIGAEKSARKRHLGLWAMRKTTMRPAS